MNNEENNVIATDMPADDTAVMTDNAAEVVLDENGMPIVNAEVPPTEEVVAESAE